MRDRPPIIIYIPTERKRRRFLVYCIGNVKWERKKHHPKNIKDFFILDQEYGIIEVGQIGLSTFITLHTRYLYSHTFIQTKSGGTKINI